MVMVTLISGICLYYSLACNFWCEKFCEGGPRVRRSLLKWSAIGEILKKIALHHV